MPEGVWMSVQSGQGTIAQIKGSIDFRKGKARGRIILQLLYDFPCSFPGEISHILKKGQIASAQSYITGGLVFFSIL